MVWTKIRNQTRHKCTFLSKPVPFHLKEKSGSISFIGLFKERHVISLLHFKYAIEPKKKNNNQKPQFTFLYNHVIVLNTLITPTMQQIKLKAKNKVITQRENISV